MGGSQLSPTLGRPARAADETPGSRINIEAAVVEGALSKDALSGIQSHWKFGKFNRELRGDIYDELLKLPLRYSLHPFEKLVAASQHSAVGYATPLGPADPVDTIPFFVHRTSAGRFPGRVRSLNPKILFPISYIHFDNVEGDVFRFEEELIKIFPTKKTYVLPYGVRVYNARADALMIMHHWLAGLGF